MEESPKVAQTSPTNTLCDTLSSITKIEEVPNDSPSLEPPKDLESQLREPGTDVSMVAIFPESDKSNPDDKKCSRCLVVMESPSRLQPCGHQFHLDCIKNWIYGPELTSD